jgi:hypothetical protein
VHLHDLELVPRERAGLVQDFVRHPDLPQVVQVGAEADRGLGTVLELERARDRQHAYLRVQDVLNSVPESPERHEAQPADLAPMRFKQLLVRMHPGEQRTVSLLFDPARIAPGTPVSVLADTGLRLKLWEDMVPPPNSRGWSRLTGKLRARATVHAGSRLTVLAEAGAFSAELEVQIVQHHASGWVREIARKDEDAQVEAHFDPESGVVTVFEGRPEFRALARAARRAGLPGRRIQEYVPYRLLEVEAAANAVYQWAAARLIERRFAGERPMDPADYARAVHFEAQALRHRAHERLMRAFLDPEVFDGAVRVVEDAPENRQTTLLDA